MLIFRWLVLMMLLGALVSFAVFALTGDQRYRQFGLFALKWAVLAGLGFFAVLVLERVA